MHSAIATRKAVGGFRSTYSFLASSPDDEMTLHQIAQAINRCERTVRRHLRQLESLGLLVVIHRPGLPNRYLVETPDIPVENPGHRRGSPCGKPRTSLWKTASRPYARARVRRSLSFNTHPRLKNLRFNLRDNSCFALAKPFALANGNTTEDYPDREFGMQFVSQSTLFPVIETKKRKKRQPKNAPIFRAIAEVCGIDWRNLNRQERGKLNYATSCLVESGANPEEIRARAATYKSRWPNASLTPTALAGNWSLLAPEKKVVVDDGSTRVNCSRCGESLRWHLDNDPYERICKFYLDEQ